MFNYFLSLFVSVPVSDAYVNVLSLVVFFSLNFCFFDMVLFKKVYIHIYIYMYIYNLINLKSVLRLLPDQQFYSNI